MLPQFLNQYVGVAIIFALFAVASAALAMLVLPLIRGKVGQRARVKQVSARGGASTNSEAAKRQHARAQVSQAVKKANELAAKNKSSGLTLDVALDRAGWTRGRQIFLILCGFCGVFSAFVLYAFSGSIFGFLSGAVFGTVGLPMIMVRVWAARRQDAFLRDLPTALDMMSRTVRGGLPITDAIAIAGRDSEGPIREEFARVHDAVVLGRPVEDAIREMYLRVPANEINFLALVVGSRQKTGGNLTEVLDNFASLLRERVMLHKRVGALTQEVRLSAIVLSAVPVVMGVALYIVQPEYVSLLWTTEAGRGIFFFALAWASVAGLMMRSFSKLDF